jgi:hypothetical protein
MHVSFDGQIARIGYNLQQRIAAPGERSHLKLCWPALKEINADCSVLAHLLSSDGNCVAALTLVRLTK